MVKERLKELKTGIPVPSRKKLELNYKYHYYCVLYSCIIIIIVYQE